MLYCEKEKNFWDGLTCNVIMVNNFYGAIIIDPNPTLAISSIEKK